MLTLKETSFSGLKWVSGNTTKKVNAVITRASLGHISVAPLRDFNLNA